MMVRISYRSSITGGRRGVCWSDETPARLDELPNRVFDFRLARHIVPQRKGARRSKPGAVHIFFKRRLLERAKYEAVHLIEDDFIILEDRRPAKALNKKTTG